MIGNWKELEGQLVDGKFRLDRYLSHSDHSGVFRMELKEPNQPMAAIKLIVTDADSAAVQLQRLQRAARISHPHLLRIFATGSCRIGANDFLYVVTEYAEEDLAQILPERALSPEEAREMLRPVLDVLSYLHQQNMVLARLKPSNIMAVNDELRVAGDGICGVGETAHGMPGQGIYQAPEIAGGSSITPAADVWSLGATVVEVLTQRPPEWQPSEPVALVVPETVPFPFLQIARRCLVIDPRQRWTIPDIRACLPLGAPPAPKPSAISLNKIGKYWKYWVPGVAVLLVLLAFLYFPAGDETPSEAQTPPAARPERSSTPAPKAALTEQKPSAASTPPTPSQERSKRESTAAAAPVAIAPTPHPTRVPTAAAGGEVSHQVLPNAPQKAMSTITGKFHVTIGVSVDDAGNVTSARIESRGPSQYFANLSLQAARNWKFTPPQDAGRNVPSEWALRFEFQRSGVTASSSRK